ncbi:MAG TPA: hypothetical protein VFI55_06910, partial [Mycobacterium sp.]|nr:hypothetical protein [Mycobacterium sp.]
FAAKLDAAGKARGQRLAWSPAEQHQLEVLADAVDRRTMLSVAFDGLPVDNVKDRVRLSGEIRQLDRLATNLSRQIDAGLNPKTPDSRRTVKAREAANVRWGKTGA